MPINPYAYEASSAPHLPIGSDFSNAEDSPLEAIRKRQFEYETSLKSAGMLFLFGAFAIGILSLVSLLSSLSMTSRLIEQKLLNFPNLARLHIPWMIMLSLTIAQIIVGLGIYRLDARHRIPAAVLSTLWLFSIVGTIPAIGVLWVLLSPKGKYTFSEEYQRVIALTQRPRTRTSLISWIILAIFVTLITIAFFAV